MLFHLLTLKYLTKEICINAQLPNNFPFQECKESQKTAWTNNNALPCSDNNLCTRMIDAKMEYAKEHRSRVWNVRVVMEGDVQ